MFFPGHQTETVATIIKIINQQASEIPVLQPGS